MYLFMLEVYILEVGFRVDRQSPNLSTESRVPQDLDWIMTRFSIFALRIMYVGSIRPMGPIHEKGKSSTP